MNKTKLIQQIFAVVVWIIKFVLMSIGIISIIAASMLIFNSTETFHIIMGCVFWVCSLILILKMGGKLL